MSELTNEQRQELQIQNLKSRILDTQDALTQAQAQTKELADVLTSIVQAIELPASENDQVQLADIVSAVEAIVEERDSLKAATVEGE